MNAGLASNVMPAGPSTPTRVFVTGDSHAVALRKGLDILVASGWDAEGVTIDIRYIGSGARLIEPFFRDVGNAAEIIIPEYGRRVAALPLPGTAPADTVYCWTGLFHFAKLWRYSGWSRFRPAFLPGTGQPVSAGLLKDVLLDWFSYQFELLELLGRIGFRTIAIETPRPFRHHPALTLVPPATAVALDRFGQEIMLAELARRSIELIRLPEGCVDEDGFMLPEWRSANPKDPHHCSDALGALMIRRIRDHLREPGR